MIMNYTHTLGLFLKSRFSENSDIVNPEMRETQVVRFREEGNSNQRQRINSGQFQKGKECKV